MMKMLGITLFFFALVLSSPLAEAQTSAKARRIVSLTLGTDEILLSLIDPKRLAAITDYAADPDISNVSQLANQVPVRIKQAGAESIVALKPDLIFVASYTNQTLVKQLKDIGFPVVTLTLFSSIDGIKKNIRAVGYAVGETEKAGKLIAKMEKRLSAVAERLSSTVKRPALLSYDLERWTAGRDTLFDEIVALAGGRNLAAEAGMTGHPKISLEAVVDLNPEVLILNAWHPDGDDVNQTLLKHPALQSLRAIRENRVYSIPGKYLTTVSHFIAEGVEAMARLLHPTLFTANISRP